MSRPELPCADAGPNSPRSPRKPRTYEATAYGILNPWGDLWTYECFESEAEAREHVEAFWRDISGTPSDLDKFTIVPVHVTVVALMDAAGNVLPSPPDQSRSPQVVEAGPGSAPNLHREDGE